MRLLHDYNYDDLHEVLFDLGRDVYEYSFLAKSLAKCPVNLDNGLLCLFTDLRDKFNQHIDEFDSVFNRINDCAVPPEGVEEIPKLVYQSHNLNAG